MMRSAAPLRWTTRAVAPTTSMAVAKSVERGLGGHGAQLKLCQLPVELRAPLQMRHQALQPAHHVAVALRRRSRINGADQHVLGAVLLQRNAHPAGEPCRPQKVLVELGPEEIGARHQELERVATLPVSKACCLQSRRGAPVSGNIMGVLPMAR